jgi:hypothetical protein
MQNSSLAGLVCTSLAKLQVFGLDVFFDRPARIASEAIKAKTKAATIFQDPYDLPTCHKGFELGLFLIWLWADIQANA